MRRENANYFFTRYFTITIRYKTRLRHSNDLYTVIAFYRLLRKKNKDSSSLFTISENVMPVAKRETKDQIYYDLASKTIHIHSPNTLALILAEKKKTQKERAGMRCQTRTSRHLDARMIAHHTQGSRVLPRRPRTSNLHVQRTFYPHFSPNNVRWRALARLGSQPQPSTRASFVFFLLALLKTLFWIIAISSLSQLMPR